MSTKPFNYYATAPDVFEKLEGVHAAIDTHGLDRTIHHLVQLRASQINGCAYCVKMHTREAREDGETDARLDRLLVWKHTTDFSERERVALEWTETLTGLDPKSDYGAVRDRLRSHFSDAEVSALTFTVAMINLWNRVQISSH